MITICPATPTDLNGIVDLENECFTSDKMQRRHYRALLTKPSALIIAKDKNKIIGCITVLFRKNSLQARIYSLAISTPYRQLGIAKKLCLSAEHQALARHCTSIILEVRPDNHAAIRFYQKNGYEIFGEYTKFYEDGTDAIRMKKIL